MAASELWLIRHGESVGNVAASRAEAAGGEVIDLDIRDADVPLSPVGRAQAYALGRWLNDTSSTIDAFWCSPYLRAIQTLDIATTTGSDARTPHLDERLRDRELGILDLLTTAGVQARHPEEVERRLHLGKFYHRPPGGESWADVALRLRSFLDGLDLSTDQHVLIVAHDAVVMLLLYVLLGMSEPELLAFAQTQTVANASVTHLVRSDHAAAWTLERFSDVTHLAEEGAPITVHPGDANVLPE